MCWESTQCVEIPPNPLRFYPIHSESILGNGARSSACRVWTVISETEFVTVLWSFKHRLLIWSASVALCWTLNCVHLLSRDFHVTGLWPLMWMSESSGTYSQYIRDMEVMGMLGMVTHLGFAIKAICHYCLDVMIRLFKSLTCLVTMLVIRPCCRFIWWSKLWFIVLSIPQTRCCLSFDVTDMAGYDIGRKTLV